MALPNECLRLRLSDSPTTLHFLENIPNTTNTCPNIFTIAVPIAWNSLFPHLCTVKSLITFNNPMILELRSYPVYQIFDKSQLDHKFHDDRGLPYVICVPNA